MNDIVHLAMRGNKVRLTTSAKTTANPGRIAGIGSSERVRHALVAVAITLSVALGTASGAYSQVLAVATVEGSFTQRVNSSTWQPVALASMTTALDFTTERDKERIVITYTASCLAAGFTVNVRANIDGLIASPGDPNGVPLCTVPIPSGSTYPASRTFSAVIPTKGAHKISIEVRGPGAAILIGDSALVVQR